MKFFKKHPVFTTAIALMLCAAVVWADQAIRADAVTNVLTTPTGAALKAANPELRQFKQYMQLVNPHRVDGTGAVLNATSTSPQYGHATFSNSAAASGNWVEYRVMVPTDIDTSVDLRAKFKFRLGGADTGTQRYVLTMASVATSAGADSPSLGQTINLDFAGDGSGASGDTEQVGYTTLTGWRSNMTADHVLVIRLARDGNNAADASTVDSSDLVLVIEYTVLQ